MDQKILKRMENFKNTPDRLKFELLKEISENARISLLDLVPGDDGSMKPPAGKYGLKPDPVFYKQPFDLRPVAFRFTPSGCPVDNGYPGGFTHLLHGHGFQIYGILTLSKF